jgi:cytochrome c biogenesis protein CcmG, thiol:disulfide interchange protein DsbE
MKPFLLFTLIFLTSFCFGKKNYYYKNDGNRLKTRAEVWLEYERTIPNFESFMKSEDSTQKISALPVIYHKEIRGDSIINYYEIRSYSKNKEKGAESDFVFQQDSMFLYLNKKFPYFKLIDIDGKEFSFDQIKGKPTLLNLTANYCSSCLQEIPRLNHLKKLYQDRINFIAIFDVERNIGDIAKAILKHPFDFHILKNTKTFKDQLNIHSLPYNIFIDKDGFIRNIQRGYNYSNGQADNNYFTKTLDELLK